MAEEASEGARKPMLTELSSDAKAWKGSRLRPDDWLLAIPDDCRAELDRVAALLADDSRDPTALSPESFALERCRDFAAVVRDRLAPLPWFVLLHPLPVVRLA